MADAPTFSAVKPINIKFNPRRGLYFDAKKAMGAAKFRIAAKERKSWEGLDLVYRTLCGILYNFGPTSGHPGGSISSGRIVQGLVYRLMAYDIGRPGADENDFIVYAAGHKALGLYAMWALRDELTRIANPALLPDETVTLELDGETCIARRVAFGVLPERIHVCR